jgi:hypothetical protein
MKRNLFTMLFGFVVVSGFSQHNNMPPKNVSQSFQKEYPQSQASQWSQSNAGWSVSFEDKDHNNGEATAYFDGSGRHVDTHIPYDKQDVPSPVKNHTQRSYGASDNYDYTRIDHSGEKTVYKTQVKHKNQDKTIYMDNGGHEKDYQDKHY